jgi:hypothetical protein
MDYASSKVVVRPFKNYGAKHDVGFSTTIFVLAKFPAMRLSPKNDFTGSNS